MLNNNLILTWLVISEACVEHWVFFSNDKKSYRGFAANFPMVVLRMSDFVELNSTQLFWVLFWDLKIAILGLQSVSVTFATAKIIFVYFHPNFGHFSFSKVFFNIARCMVNEKKRSNQQLLATSQGMFCSYYSILRLFCLALFGCFPR